jgi:hypothetical protein
MKSAQEVCAMLLLRSIKTLNSEEEELIADYMADIGYEVTFDKDPRGLCQFLLEDAMQQELGHKAPMTAYAHSVIDAQAKVREERKKLDRLRELDKKRGAEKKRLASNEKKLPGCNINKSILKNVAHKLRFDEKLGYDRDTGRHAAVVAVSSRLYNQIFLEIDNPVVELMALKTGKVCYARIAEAHEEADDVVYVSELVSDILGTKRGDVVMKLCNSLPSVKHIDLTYYGTQAELDGVLEEVIQNLQVTINGFSYVFLGMELYVETKDGRKAVRVDGLYDDEMPIFAGLIPFGENDVPFEIKPDDE